MSEASGNQTDTGVERYQYPKVNGPTTAEVVRACSQGDYVAFCRGSYEGDVRWSHKPVSDAGDDWVEFGRFRLEVVEDDELARFCKGEEGVRVTEPEGYRERETMPSATGIERIPATVLDSEQWYQWQVGVSETQSAEAVSTDQSVLVEAPKRKLAKATAKRRAELDRGYVQTCARERELETDE